MIGFLSRWLRRKPKRSIITEPINIVTGTLGAGKTLFAIEQADLLRQNGDASAVYQLGINKPDLRKLPELPCPIEDWHVLADEGKLNGAVIIVDEFHKWMPQRGMNSRPPKFVEEMAEARKRGVRFILLTQSSEFDHFLKGTRLNRHFYLSRKLGFGKSTIYEWMARFVANPEENEPARKAAILHQWSHPVRKYGDWYESAASHHFRVRIPLRLWLVPIFIGVVIWFAWGAYTKVGAMMEPNGSTLGRALTAKVAQGETSHGQSGDKPQVTMDVAEYLRRFNPIVPAMPFSAPVYQEREVVSEPHVICVAAGAGLDGQGVRQPASCNCYTEQMTPYRLEEAQCQTIARHGMYNPYKLPSDREGSGAVAEADRKAEYRPGPPTAAPFAVTISGSPAPGSFVGSQGSAP